MRPQHVLGSATVVGLLVVLFLIAVGVVRHPASVQGTGSGLVWMDVALLLTYGKSQGYGCGIKAAGK